MPDDRRRRPFARAGRATAGHVLRREVRPCLPLGSALEADSPARRCVQRALGPAPQSLMLCNGEQDRGSLQCLKTVPIRRYYDHVASHPVPGCIGATQAHPTVQNEQCGFSGVLVFGERLSRLQSHESLAQYVLVAAVDGLRATPQSCRCGTLHVLADFGIQRTSAWAESATHPVIVNARREAAVRSPRVLAARCRFRCRSDAATCAWQRRSHAVRRTGADGAA